MVMVMVMAVSVVVLGSSVAPAYERCNCAASARTWSAGATGWAEREEGSGARSMTLSFQLLTIVGSPAPSAEQPGRSRSSQHQPTVCSGRAIARERLRAGYRAGKAAAVHTRRG
eukprot:scaffold109561_cov34-Tisochrysis_lutea.AAC.1